ncbi:hypothetical protein JTE90_018403 [Oedothorax gibbosus]|uniref:Uncharacterized protein n=1 Tax=Oedothorax gibbosus TaxID=931172 RepID=A0AAV6TXL7_9ARAC|nr:hypothetical protein JTE90_018403 [Oedothorax gibbosus]
MDKIGCIDLATYHYLAGMLPHVEHLPLSVMDGNLHLLTPGQDPEDLVFFRQYLADSWHLDKIGCLDTATFHYLLGLMPQVELLSPQLMEGRLDLLGGQDPIALGKEAAKRVLANMKYAGSEEFWDI